MQQDNAEQVIDPGPEVNRETLPQDLVLSRPHFLHTTRLHFPHI